MADSNFFVIAATAGVQEISSLETQDVIEATIASVPSNVRYPLRFPDGYFNQGNVEAAAAVSADAIETAMAWPEVAGISYEQAVDASGALIDQMRVLVRSADGRLVEPLTTPLTTFVGGGTGPAGYSGGQVGANLNMLDALQQQVASLAAELNAIAGLGAAAPIPVATVEPTPPPAPPA